MKGFNNINSSIPKIATNKKTGMLNIVRWAALPEKHIAKLTLSKIVLPGYLNAFPFRLISQTV